MKFLCHNCMRSGLKMLPGIEEKTIAWKHPEHPEDCAVCGAHLACCEDNHPVSDQDADAVRLVRYGYKNGGNANAPMAQRI